MTLPHADTNPEAIFLAIPGLLATGFFGVTLFAALQVEFWMLVVSWFGMLAGVDGLPALYHSTFSRSSKLLLLGTHLAGTGLALIQFTVWLSSIGSSID